MKRLKKPVPFYYLFITIILFTGILTYTYFHPVKVVEKAPADNNNLQYFRNKNYKLTKPLLMVEGSKEDPALENLKDNLNSYLTLEKSSGKINSASVYVRDLFHGKWMSINPDEQFSPGSMMKVVTLISYLKDSEKNPGLLDQKVLFRNNFSEMPTQKIVTGHLSLGKEYTVRELLETMIIDSDNNATALLNARTNFDTYFGLLKNINLDVPELSQTDYPITSVQFSRLLRILFNSSFLSPDNSEYALNLMTQSKFADGIAKAIPPDIKIAHKFGERFLGKDQQLHEAGIIYLENNPYLLTVMTRGTDQEALKGVLSEVSRQVYDFMKVR